MKHVHTVAILNIYMVKSVGHWSLEANNNGKSYTTAHSTYRNVPMSILMMQMGMAVPSAFWDMLNQLLSSDDKGFPTVKRLFQVLFPNPLHPFLNYSLPRRDLAMIKVTQWRLSSTFSFQNVDFPLLSLHRNCFSDGSNVDFFYPIDTASLLLLRRRLAQSNPQNYLKNVTLPIQLQFHLHLLLLSSPLLFPHLHMRLRLLLSAHYIGWLMLWQVRRTRRLRRGEFVRPSHRKSNVFWKLWWMWMTLEYNSM